MEKRIERVLNKGKYGEIKREMMLWKGIKVVTGAMLRTIRKSIKLLTKKK